MPALGTKTELNALVGAALLLGDKPEAKHLLSLHAKLTKKREKPAGAAAAQIEQALVTHSAGKVLPVMGGPSFWAIQSRNYGNVGATPEQAEMVGKWLANQAWLKTTYTIDSLYFKWPSYLAKAKAEEQGSQNVNWDREDWTP